jgi:hypothetical protein
MLRVNTVKCNVIINLKNMRTFLSVLIGNKVTVPFVVSCKTNATPYMAMNSIPRLVDG